MEKGVLTDVLTVLIERNHVILEEVEANKKYPAKTRIFYWNGYFVVQVRKEDDPDDFWEIVDPVAPEEYILGKKFAMTEWVENFPPNPWKSLD